MDITELLAFSAKQGASDLFVTTGAPPSLKIDGRIIPVKTSALTSEESRDFAYSIMEWLYDDDDPIQGNITQPVVPLFPDSPFPPEATQTMHRKDIIEEIGYWRRPWEVYSFQAMTHPLTGSWRTS